MNLLSERNSELRRQRDEARERERDLASALEGAVAMLAELGAGRERTPDSRLGDAYDALWRSRGAD
jgi:hypothetical protein